MFSRHKRKPVIGCLFAMGLALVGLGGVYTLGLVTPGLAEQRAGDVAAHRTGILRLGIVPQQSASKLAAIWGPVAAYLSERTGVKVVFMTTKNIPTFEACLKDGAFDIAYMNPYHYVVFSDRSAYRALAHQTDKKLRGLMVVHKDSAVASIDDLDGSTIAFPSPGAFGASVVPRAEMLAKGLSFTPRYVKSHDSVYRAVAAGLADAGGGVTRTFNSTSAEVRDQLRMVFRTDAYTPHAIATSANVSEDMRAMLGEAFSKLATDAPELLAPLGMTGFEIATDDAWNDVRALGLQPEQAGLERIDTLSCPFD